MRGRFQKSQAIGAGLSNRVLFVDDMPDMGALIVDMLQLEGIDAEWCGSGCDAVERLRGGAYDALITDLILPGEVDGEALAVLARSQGMPVLVVTGDADAVERLGEAGFLASLKPVDVIELIEWVREAEPRRAAASGCT